MKTFCIQCGQPHVMENYPKVCSNCNKEMYENPIPVAVVVVPVVNEGVLLIQRGIEPKIGYFAFPGGYVNSGESAEEAAIREVYEEVGLKLNHLEFLMIQSPPNKKTILLFYKSNPVKLSDIQFTPNKEVLSIKIVKQPIELAFPIHSDILKQVLGKIVF